MTMKNTLLIMARWFIGAVFILSAVTKLAGTGVFEISLIEQGITPDRFTAAILTRLLIGFEIFLAVSFFLPFLLRRVIIPLTLATLMGFTLYLAYFLLFRSEMEDCGCFGEMIKMTPLESILKNIVLIAVVLFIYRYYRTDNKQWLPAVLLYSLCTVLIFIFFPIRSVENLTFAKYTRFENKGIVDLTQGDKLVVLLSMDCEDCLDKATKLSELYRTERKLPELYYFIWGDHDSLSTFMTRSQSEFPYLLLSDADFFSMIGDAPPRLYWLQNGEVKEYWDKDIIERLRKTFSLK